MFLSIFSPPSSFLRSILRVFLADRSKKKKKKTDILLKSNHNTGQYNIL